MFAEPGRRSIRFAAVGDYVYEPATIAGFAFVPLSAEWVPERSTGIGHLRDDLGEETYESLARKGEPLSTAQIVTYAYDQIGQARAGLNAVSK